MTKEEIIKQLREKGIEFNPNAQVATLEKLLNTVVEQKQETPKEENQSIVGVLESITKTLSNLDNRLGKLEGKQSTEYRSDAKDVDIEKAAKTKKDIDQRIVQIVEESLGTDFGIEVEQFSDRPGFLFSVIVPQRLSDLTEDSRPIKDEEGQNKKDSNDNVLYETYFPEDKRSRAIGSMQSYDAIKDHCDRVRSYIVSYYQKAKQPLPEFKLK